MAQSLSYGQIVALCKQRGFKDPYLAAAVAMAESGGNPGAINAANSDGSTDRGLFQINSVHGALSTTDLHANIDAAFKISSGGTDWSPWVAFTSGAYKRYLDPNAKAAPVAGARSSASTASAGSGGPVVSEEQRSGALRALLWIVLVIGGAAMTYHGFARMTGLRPAKTLPGVK